MKKAFTFSLLLFCLMLGVQAGAAGAVPAKGASAMDKVLGLYRQKDYLNAARGFYTLTARGGSPEAVLKAKLYLGLSLYRLRLYQVSVFPLIEVAQRGNKDQIKLAIDYLIAAGDKLEETTLLNFALKRAKITDIGETAKSVYLSRIAERQIETGEYDKAILSLQNFQGSRDETRKAFYLLGLAYLKAGEPLKAIPFFERLMSDLKGEPVTSSKRGMAIVGLARARYQAKQWDEALRIYRMIPKDNPLYREVLFEMSWAFFRSGQFRSAMTPLETLHSPFYQNSYAPESLLLRGVILLFICQYEQIPRVLDIFDSSYRAGLQQVDSFLETKPSDAAGFAEMESADRNLFKIQKGQEMVAKSVLPFFMTRSLWEESDLRQMAKYLSRLNREKAILKKTLSNPAYHELSSYSSRVLDGRISRTKLRIGRHAINHLKDKSAELQDLAAQMDFLKYEMINGQRESLRRKLSVNYQSVENTEMTRNYFIQNGYRYWPFQGEYWRDEIGNYQYFGANACE